jgi:hypothetical protein
LGLGLAAGWAFCGFDAFFVAIHPPKSFRVSKRLRAGWATGAWGQGAESPPLLYLCRRWLQCRLSCRTGARLNCGGTACGLAACPLGCGSGRKRGQVATPSRRCTSGGTAPWGTA